MTALLHERWLLAALHLLPFGVGFAAIVIRSLQLRELAGPERLGRVFAADAWWGIAALVWLATGLWRAFGGVEKGTAYYMASPLFWAKMGLFGLILLLELWPMITLVQWRIRRARRQPLALTHASTFATIGFVQAALLLVMMLLATGMARGAVMA